MLSTPFTCCSMGVATDRSLVLAAAPVNVELWLFLGGMIEGNCAMGSPSNDTAPISTVRMAITIATMGRRTKNAELTSLPRLPSLRASHGRRAGGGGRQRLRHHRDAVADLLHPLGHHL